VYTLFGAKDRLRYTRFDFPHNYNQTTREAVYAFFAQHLLGKPAADRIPEIPYTAEKPDDLKAFPDGRMPADAIGEAEFTSAWIAERRGVVEKRLRSKDASAESLRVWRHTLLIDPSEPVVGESAESTRNDGIVRSEVAFGRPGKGDRVSGVLWIPAKAGDTRSLVVLVHPDGAQVAEKGGAERARMEGLVARGHAVLAITPFQCGPGMDSSVVGRSPFQDFFAGYNRTVLQQRVRDVASAATFARMAKPDAPVVLLGAGRAALWAAFAAPMADALVVDPAGLGRTDAEWIRPEDFVPGIHLLGDAEGALVAAGPKPVLREATASAEKLDRWVGSLPRR